MRPIHILGLLIGLHGAGAAAVRADPPARGSDPLWASSLVGSTALSAERLRTHVDYLARPAWSGRAPGSPGADSCARYIELWFRRVGLQPVRPEGAMRFTTPLSSAVRIQGAVGLRDERRGYTFGRDYWPQGFSSDGEVLSTLVFAGYGISTAECGYDDYAGIDVRGRVVVVMSGGPGASSAALFPEYPSWTSTPFAKARLAHRRGAAAILLLTAPVGAGPADRPWGVPQERGYLDAGIPACHLSGAAGESLLAASGLRLAEVQEEIDRTRQPRSRELPDDSVQVLVHARRLPGSATSVAAMLPGRTAETVVVAACYDGYGSTPPQPIPVTCPGAVDNASGTAALLEMARALREAPVLERTICFVAYAGRDLEGAGFDTFLNESGLDLGQVVAVIELAALGRLRENRLHAVGDREAFASAVRGVQELLSDTCQVRWRSPAPEGTLPHRLARAGISSVGFSSGNEPEFGTPADGAERLDATAAIRAARLVYGLIRSVGGARR